jgi:hypothetical protein
LAAPFRQGSRRTITANGSESNIPPAIRQDQSSRSIRSSFSNHQNLESADSAVVAEEDDTEKIEGGVRKGIAMLLCGGLLLVAVAVGVGVGVTLNKDDGAKYESPTSAPFTLQDELREKLASFSLDGDSVFDDPVSPQNLAVEWLAENTVWQVENSTLRMETRYGLAVLYYSTQGDKWQETYEFLTDSDECTWNNGDEEQNRTMWKGVICNEEDQVIGISLGMYLLLL